MNLTEKIQSTIYRLRLIARHYKFMPEKRRPARCCILRIDGRIPNGGLCDRLRGIATIYLHCKMHGLRFGIVFDHPFDLEAALQPNVYDWRVQENETGTSLWNVSVRVLFGGGGNSCRPVIAGKPIYITSAAQT